MPSPSADGSSAVAGYQRSSIANSLPGAHPSADGLTAKSAAMRDQGTSAGSSVRSRSSSQKRSSSKRFHNSSPRKQSPKRRDRSRRALSSRTRATAASSSGGSTSEG